MDTKILRRVLDAFLQSKPDLALGQGHALDMALDKVAMTHRQLLSSATCVEVITQCGNDERLELGCGNTVERSECPRFILQHGLGDVIAVARAALVGMGRAHAVAALIKDAAA